MYCNNNDFYNNDFYNTNIIQDLHIYPKIHFPEHINMSNHILSYKWNN